MAWTSLLFSFLVEPTRTKLGQLYDNCVHVARGLSAYASDSGSVNTCVVTLSPAPAAYTEGMSVRFKAKILNTGTSTLNVNSLGAKTIKKNGADTVAGDIKPGAIYEMIYDGTNFQIVGG